MYEKWIYASLAGENDTKNILIFPLETDRGTEVNILCAYLHGLQHATLSFPSPKIKATSSVRMLISMCNGLHFSNLPVRSFAMSLESIFC